MARVQLQMFRSNLLRVKAKGLVSSTKRTAESGIIRVQLVHFRNGLGMRVDGGVEVDDQADSLFTSDGCGDEGSPPERSAFELHYVWMVHNQ